MGGQLRYHLTITVMDHPPRRKGELRLEMLNIEIARALGYTLTTTGNQQADNKMEKCDNIIASIVINRA